APGGGQGPLPRRDPAQTELKCRSRMPACYLHADGGASLPLGGVGGSGVAPPDRLARGLGVAPTSHPCGPEDFFLNHYRASSLNDAAPLEVRAHGPSEHHALDVAADARELVGAVGVAHARDVLLDDRALVEVLGRVVRRGADHLDAARVRLVV